MVNPNQAEDGDILILTDGPLQRTHEGGHDRGLQYSLSDLGKHLGCENLQGATGLSNHFGLPEYTEDIPDDRV